MKKKARYPKQRGAIIKESSRNPFLSARELAVDVTSTSGIIVTPQTIRIIHYNANIRESLLGEKIISETKDLNLQKLMSANHWNFEKILLFPIKASSIFLTQMLRKLGEES